MKAENSGFALITAALTVLLVFSLSLGLLLQTSTRWDLVRKLEAQLHALVLAENGLEYARTLLPHLELKALLLGPDGQHCGTEEPEWRNPIPFFEASELILEKWNPRCDDGLPAHRGELLMPRGFELPGGYFFVRMSNNPGEPAEQDVDGEILVRSMGLVPLNNPTPMGDKSRNSVAMLEARLRQERPFRLPGPLTLLGNSGSFRWEGNNFRIDGKEAFGIYLIPDDGNLLQKQLSDSLSPAQAARIQGRGLVPSIQNVAPLEQSYPHLGRLLNAGFWQHLLDQLPKFADSRGEGIHYLAKGGLLKGAFSGLLVARGRLVLTPGTRLEGILLHLGGGALVLQTGTRVEGGIWMSNPDLEGAPPDGHLWLEVAGSAEIVYRREAIDDALSWLPPTQLGWRMLFAETAR